VTEGQNRCHEEAHRQRSQHNFQQGGGGKVFPRRWERPRLVKKNVNQKQNGLKNGQKADEARWYSHVYLDSRNTQKVICKFTVQQAVCYEE
jgi:hypothetical protein